MTRSIAPTRIHHHHCCWFDVVVVVAKVAPPRARKRGNERESDLYFRLYSREKTKRAESVPKVEIGTTECCTRANIPIQRLFNAKRESKDETILSNASKAAPLETQPTYWPPKGTDGCQIVSYYCETRRRKTIRTMHGVPTLCPSRWIAHIPLPS